MTTTEKVPGPEGHPPPPKPYGERTVGMMIERALAQAGLRRALPKTTGYLVALVDDRLKTSARRTWILVSIVVLVLVVGLGAAALAAWYWYRTPAPQTTQINYGEPLGTGIAASNRYNVFLLAGNRGSGLEGFCSAFAISGNLLATNAHCIAEARAKFGGFVALMNGAPGRSYQIIRTVIHPSYVPGQLSADVGLVEIRGQLPSACALASATELSTLSAGSTVFVYGFPATLSSTVAPEATLTRGEVGRLTTFSLVAGDAATNVLIQHSAFISGGTSGSPMFDGQGKVVGINAGGYAESGAVLPGYNFGVRVDVATALLRSFGAP